MNKSLLATDGYKFSMAEAGWPLRRETFYYSHRKGGLQYLPVDVESFIHQCLPKVREGDFDYLASAGYEMGIGFKSAIAATDRLRIQALPKGSWFHEREPVFTLTGPSALVSWIEPLALQLNFRIQIATLALTSRPKLEQEVKKVTCESTRSIVIETLDGLGIEPPPMDVCEEAYRQRVRERIRELIEIVGDANRLFEVGMRAATSLEEHRIALQVLKEEGVQRTSHVALARELGMIPVGTMGHEHVQRYGSDEAAFRAMCDRRPNVSSFLLDTYDTFLSGIPAAYRVIRDRPDAGDSIRYDSGDKVSQYLYACSRAAEARIRPVHILEDGFDASLTREFELLRKQVGWEKNRQFYGYGGYLVAKPSLSGLTRDRVGAVWKVTQTGDRPTMKFGDEAGGGKESVPGRPVVFRRAPARRGPIGIIGQEGEPPPDGYENAYDTDGVPLPLAEHIDPPDLTVVSSAATRDLIRQLRSRHARFAS